MKLLLCTISACVALSYAAHAVQVCKPEKKDTRVVFCQFDPNDIYKVWSAPGAELMLRLAPDEQILNAQAADSNTIKAAWADSISTFKFQGCAVPQQVFVVSHKASNDETRTYIFSMETIPQICAADIPGPPQQPNANVANAAYVDGAPQRRTLEAQPDLRHLEHPDDLAEGGHIPYVVTIRYPSDERAKREAAAAIAAKHERKLLVERTLSAAAAGIGPTTGFVNNSYVGRGDSTIRPAGPALTTAVGK